MASNLRQGDFWPPVDSLIGMCVRLDRYPCHDNVAEIGVGRGTHCHALFCATCGQFRGWLPKAASEFLINTVRTFGVPREPLIYRDATMEMRTWTCPNSAEPPS